MPNLADNIRRARPAVLNMELWSVLAWPLIVVTILAGLAWRSVVLERMATDGKAYVEQRDAAWTADRVKMMRALERIEARVNR